MTMSIGSKSSSSDLLMGAGGAQLLGSLGSILGLIAFIKAVLPAEVWNVVRLLVDRLTSGAGMDFFHRLATATVDEYEGYETNQIYKDVDLYVASLVQMSVRKMRRLRLTKTSDAAAHSYGLASGETVEDCFSGTPFKWTHQRRTVNDKHLGGLGIRGGYRDMEGVHRSYSLEFPKKSGTALLPEYLEHISAKAETLRHVNAQRMLFTNRRDEMWRPWNGRPFQHPACFSSIAMEPELKRKLMEDLKTFMSAQEFYKRVGRAWKRGYLLYGPPGTGKSSLIAAMANFTGYDVYDLELTAVSNNSDLRKLLTAVPSKSIIVIEDIDCSIKIKKRGKPAEEDRTGDKKDKVKAARRKKDGGESMVTLSGLLNFADGLWSCTGGERLIIFTTNFVEKVDQALLRSGRMDFHINMSYCCFEAFKVLAWTHLLVADHPIFSEIEALLREVEVTPADVAEALARSRNLGAERALQELSHQLRDPTSKLRQKIPPKENEASSDEESEVSK